MRQSPLLGYFEQLGASIGDYRGTQMALALPGEPDLGVALERLAMFDLSWRSVLRARGPDARQWLNGVITANVRDLLPNETTPSFLLNVKGQIVATLHVVAESDSSFLLLTDAQQRQTLHRELDRFIIMEDVELSDISDQLTSLAMYQPASPASGGERISSALEDRSEPRVLHHVFRGQLFEFIVTPSAAMPLWQALRGAGACELGAAAQERLRILSGSPLFGVDIHNTDLPQETEQPQAMHFAKGCYIGQEIVERIRSRGGVHRKFTGILLDGAVAPGAHIQRAGDDIGQVTSAVELGNGTCAALGYVRRKDSAVGTEVTAGEVHGRLVSLPFPSDVLAK